ncbi:MAG: hypothetical protein AMJ60_07600 [Desulfobacterales bacterium SG8_35]|nr:MAG: hypothetical protein AMJ60_07600 [Desulfobacterales bacterium SG8_35]
MLSNGSNKSYSGLVDYLLIGFLFLFFSAIATGLIMPGSAQAEDEGWGPGQDKWKFELGGYFPSIDTELQINGIDIGDELDLEDKLGFSNSDTIWRLDGYWRFFKRHRLGFGFYQFNRDGSRTLDDEIEIGDEVFPIGAQVNSELNLGFYTIDYLYSFYQGEKWEISGLIGAYWVDFKFSAAGKLAIGETEFDEFFESTDFNGPLPHLGLAFEYYITPKWLAIVKGGYFQLSVADIDGKLLNLGAKLEYQFTRTFGLGVGYDSFRIDVTADDGELRSDIVYKYHGVQAYGILRF